MPSRALGLSLGGACAKAVAMRKLIPLSFLILALGTLGCATRSQSGVPTDPAVATAKETPPVGQLPKEVTPTHYALRLDVDPRQERFSGEVRIRTDISDTRAHIWLHGKNLQVSDARVQFGGRNVAAKFQMIEPDIGLARLDLDEAIGPGEAVLQIQYDAPYDHNLQGLYQVHHDGEKYAFTQFESHFARQCFPSFDEPRFKTPFDIQVVTYAEDVAVTTTAEVSRKTLSPGRTEIQFGTTAALPTYLIAFAVGPLDVVDAGPLPPAGVRKEALPFRGVAAKGKGPQLKYAMEHTGPLLEALEAYFGRPYPFSKLDIIAVPDFASGAMENVGAVTFRETLLLLDPDNAPIEQRKGFSSVMAHELAHMWFGNLVTMPWWDDIWLNEAFATWMAARIVTTVHPEYDGDVALQERVQRAMQQDSLVSARQIRQPIESTHDIRNAFDSITYSKGGGVLDMFERYLGENTFQEGLRRYMERHQYGSATYADLLTALSQAAERDVTTSFESFLFQPGLPHLETRLSCEKKPVLHLSQSRFLPVGSTGETNQAWQIPICARYGKGDAVHESCTLLRDREGTLALDFCPDWFMPNAQGSGYFRFSLPGKDLEALLSEGRPHLSTKERLAIADALNGSIAAASMPADDIFARVPVLTQDPHRAVVLAPVSWLEFAADHLVKPEEQKRVYAFAQKSYRPVLQKLGLAPKGQEEAGDVRQLRSGVVGFLALAMADEDTLNQAAALGRAYIGFAGDNEIHPDAVEPSLVGNAMAAAVRKEGQPFFDALLAHLEKSQDALLRSYLVRAMSHATEPELAKRARELSIDPRLRGNERLIPLFVQSGQSQTRADAWKFVMDNYDALVEVLPNTHLGAVPYVASPFCEETTANEVEAFFAPRVAELPGGPRNLASVLESIKLCAVRAERHRSAAARFFKNTAM